MNDEVDKPIYIYEETSSFTQPKSYDLKQVIVSYHPQFLELKTGIYEVI